MLYLRKDLKRAKATILKNWRKFAFFGKKNRNNMFTMEYKAKVEDMDFPHLFLFYLSIIVSYLTRQSKLLR